MYWTCESILIEVRLKQNAKQLTAIMLLYIDNCMWKMKTLCSGAPENNFFSLI